MANSVSNDALWEKLLEISEQLKGSKQTDNTPDFNELKEEIFAKIQSEADILGKHGDSNYGAIKENIATANKKIDKIGASSPKSGSIRRKRPKLPRPRK